jgi:predicted HicB family RNase H-like nuclease
MTSLTSVGYDDWQATFEQKLQGMATYVLENSQVLFLPKLKFALEDQEIVLIQSALNTNGRKNISYDPNTETLASQQADCQQQQCLERLVKRYAEYSTHFIHELLTAYLPGIERGRTSLRINQAKDRESSIKKDDQRLHVDTFPSNPVGKNRILRIFSNISPKGEDRVWELGEPFQQVAERFVPQCRRLFPGEACLLKLCKITKSRRTEYDHYMLQIHDHMKADDEYQRTVMRHKTVFPVGTSWIAFTDAVSHAALAGQYMLEQTFYVPTKFIKHKEFAPQLILKKMLNRDIF